MTPWGRAEPFTLQGLCVRHLEKEPKGMGCELLNAMVRELDTCMCDQRQEEHDHYGLDQFL